VRTEHFGTLRCCGPLFVRQRTACQHVSSLTVPRLALSSKFSVLDTWRVHFTQSPCSCPELFSTADGLFSSSIMRSAKSASFLFSGLTVRNFSSPRRASAPTPASIAASI